jgi:hypothetical protein
LDIECKADRTGRAGRAGEIATIGFRQISRKRNFSSKESQQSGRRRDATDSLMRKKTSLSEFPKYFLIRTGCRAIVHQYQYE